MNAYLERVIETVKAKTFQRTGVRADRHGSVHFHCAGPRRASWYEKFDLLGRMVEPERMFTFRVVWMDDNGNYHTNTGYRCQFNGAIGPIRVACASIRRCIPALLSSWALNRSLKQPDQPAHRRRQGGSDFDPRGKSDAEIMRFCQSYMSALYRYIGPDIDVPRR